MLNGWIRLHRKLSEWEWYGDSKTLHLFIHLLLKANYKPSEWRGIRLAPGQLVTGRKQLSAETGISEQSIRTSLERLKSTSEITISSTNRFSVVTVCNYSLYQNESEFANQPDSQQLTNNQPATNHIQEDKKLRIRNTDDSDESSGSRPRGCSQEQWGRYLSYSRTFLEEQQKRWGPLIKISNSRVQAGAKALDNLVRVQGFDPRVVYETVEWARNDDFWQQQLRSLGSLTKKGRNDELKFSNILSQRTMEAQNAQRHAQ